jgi:hypothetical protein
VKFQASIFTSLAKARLSQSQAVMCNQNLPHHNFRFTHQQHPLTIPKAKIPHKSQKQNYYTTNITMEDTTKSSTSSADSSITFTPNETKLICAIMQNLTSEIQVSQPSKAFHAITLNLRRRNCPN